MIRVDPQDWEAIRKLAKQDDVSMSEYVRRLVRRSLAQRTQPA